jgi:hypothetical protein
MTQYFTQSPEPAVPGQLVKVCYSGSLPASATVTCGGNATVFHLHFESGNGCDSFLLSSDAFDFLVEDDGGFSEDFAGLVE